MANALTNAELTITLRIQLQPVRTRQELFSFVPLWL